MNKVLTIIISVVLGLSVSSLARAAVSDHVSEIQISKSTEYYQIVSKRYNIDVAVLCDTTVDSGAVQFPDGEIRNLVNDDDPGWFDCQRIFPNEASLASVPAGDYIFTIYYIDGSSDTTTVFYGEPGCENIPLITEEPLLINPQPGENNVSIPVTFEWQAVTDPKVLTIGIEWKPTCVHGLSGDVGFTDTTTTQYGQVQLTQNVEYEVDISFNRAYWSSNSDGIKYVIDADSEQKFYFHTTQNSLLGDIN